MEAILGTLLQFDGHKKSAEAGPPFTGGAQILIFTGVRYERGAPPPPAAGVAAKGRKRKRV